MNTKRATNKNVPKKKKYKINPKVNGFSEQRTASTNAKQTLE